jgi:hypothetical protein
VGHTGFAGEKAERDLQVEEAKHSLGAVLDRAEQVLGLLRRRPLPLGVFRVLPTHTSSSAFLRSHVSAVCGAVCDLIKIGGTSMRATVCRKDSWAMKLVGTTLMLLNAFWIIFSVKYSLGV